MSKLNLDLSQYNAYPIIKRKGFDGGAADVFEFDPSALPVESRLMVVDAAIWSQTHLPTTERGLMRADSHERLLAKEAIARGY